MSCWAAGGKTMTVLLSEKGGGAAQKGAPGEAGTWGQAAVAGPGPSSRGWDEAGEPAAEPADNWRTAAGKRCHSQVTQLRGCTDFVFLTQRSGPLWFWSIHNLYFQGTGAVM